MAQGAARAGASATYLTWMLRAPNASAGPVFTACPWAGWPVGLGGRCLAGHMARALAKTS